MRLFDRSSRKKSPVREYSSLSEIKQSYCDQSKFYYDQGIALYEIKQHPEAEACFRKAIQLNPTFAWAYCNLAVVLDDMGRHQEALDLIDKAISLDPRDRDFHERRQEIL